MLCNQLDVCTAEQFLATSAGAQLANIIFESAAAATMTTSLLVTQSALLLFPLLWTIAFL